LIVHFFLLSRVPGGPKKLVAALRKENLIVLPWRLEAARRAVLDFVEKYAEPQHNSRSSPGTARLWFGRSCRVTPLLHSIQLNHRCDITSGVLGAESAGILREFFIERRR